MKTANKKLINNVDKRESLRENHIVLIYEREMKAAMQNDRNDDDDDGSSIV